MSQKLIGLEDLPDNFRVGVEENFRRELFRKATEKIGKVVKLAEELRCHTDTILNLKKRKSFLKIEHLRKLSEITKTPLDKIEKHLIELKTRDRKRKVKIKLPIFASPELASLIGHSMGDGNLSERQFSFFNKQRELVDEVIKNVKIAFSTDVEPIEFEKGECWEVEFPTCIARLIALVGGPIGKKVFLSFKVPEWIKNGDDQIKIAFVRALFDDEGWIKVKFIRQSSSTQRMIGINMAKNGKFVKEHKLFLEEIRKILLDLGITSSEIKEMGKTKNGVSMGFTISNLVNLKKFLTTIGFNQKIKHKKLMDTLNNSKRFHELFPNESLISTKSLFKV